jgi:quercetin dioxygenase-like cupin family protein
VAHAGQEIQGPNGFRLRLVETAAETGGELLVMEATYGGSGGLPPEHLHPGQAERFEVLEGAVRAIIAGAERRYTAGETFDVPAGTPHQMTADEPARVRWEVRPALRTAEFFERLYGAGPDSARAADSFVEFMAEFSDEVQLT